MPSYRQVATIKCFIEASTQNNKILASFKGSQRLLLDRSFSPSIPLRLGGILELITLIKDSKSYLLGKDWNRLFPILFNSVQCVSKPSMRIVKPQVYYNHWRSAGKEEVEASPEEEAEAEEEYDSVAGTAGVYSSLDELEVFNPTAILPCFVVVYKAWLMTGHLGDPSSHWFLGSGNWPMNEFLPCRLN